MEGFSRVRKTIVNTGGKKEEYPLDLDEDFVSRHTDKVWKVANPDFFDRARDFFESTRGMAISISFGVLLVFFFGVKTGEIVGQETRSYQPFLTDGKGPKAMQEREDLVPREKILPEKGRISPHD